LESEHGGTIVMAGIIGGMILLGLVAIIGGFIHYRRERLLAHDERMKALELGRELPEDAATARIKAAYEGEKSAQAPTEARSMAAQCYSTTGYVCGAGFVFAWMSGPGVAYALAAAAGAVGVTGMICGTILASREAAPAPFPAASKPRYDPEAI
jgi:hypothetical protein